MELPQNLKVLVIEDENDLRELIVEQLNDAGMQTDSLPNAEGFEDKLRSFQPDMLLIDQAMPGMSGTQVIKKIREMVEFSFLPVMMLTAHASEEDKIDAIEMGADDFLSKPYSSKELIIRVQALVRRSLMAQRAGQKRLEIEELSLDLLKQQTFFKGQEVKLTSTEFRLLRELLSSAGNSVSRDMLREKALGHLDVNDRTIDVHILYLRRKLGEVGDRIETVRGQGYRFTLAHQVSK